MSTTTHSKFEPALTKYFSTSNGNQDHELWYRIRILKFAKLLHEQLGGDIDLVCALVLLKNRRVFFEFADNRDEDISSIRSVLKEINFPENKTHIVIKQLEKQDHQTPISIEEKIVNDAFILGGLGVVGLARFFSWLGYSNTIPGSLANIERVFKERLENIATPQGLNLAEKENKFVYLFSGLLHQEPFVEVNFRGKYIILEGNSGTGKNKQAELLKIYFEKMGLSVTIVEEPTQYYKDYEAYFEAKMKTDLANSAPIFRLYSIIGDRHNQIQNKVKQALIDGDIVISIRSYISMLVYQCENENDRLYVNFIHQFVPKPTIVILYDTSEEVCLQRVMERGTSMTLFDKLESLKKYRPIFLELVKSHYFDFPFEMVDASGTVEQVSDDTIKVIAKYI